MISFFELYISGFFVWLGLTILISLFLHFTINLLVILIGLFKPEVAKAFYDNESLKKKIKELEEK